MAVMDFKGLHQPIALGVVQLCVRHEWDPVVVSTSFGIPTQEITWNCTKQLCFGISHHIIHENVYKAMSPGTPGILSRWSSYHCTWTGPPLMVMDAKPPIGWPSDLPVDIPGRMHTRTHPVTSTAHCSTSLLNPGLSLPWIKGCSSRT